MLVAVEVLAVRARVGEDALGDLGQKLVAASYVVVNDFYKIERETDKRGKVYWSTNARAYAYKLDLDESSLYDFYEKCWIYDEDDEATRAAKISAFNNLAIGLVPVASASTSATSSTVEDAAAECLSGLITGLENQISDWEVAVTVSARRPLRAKIGTKEGLKNGDRYRAYSYREDNNGNLVSVPRGFLRATEVSSNTGMSIGETEPSEFYQISGLANIDEGWTIKQSNDLGLGVMAGIKTGSMGKLALAVAPEPLLRSDALRYDRYGPHRLLEHRQQQRPLRTRIRPGAGARREGRCKCGIPLASVRQGVRGLEPRVHPGQPVQAL